MDLKNMEGDIWAKRVAQQSKIPTLDKKLCITVCPSGSPFTRQHNPHQPYTSKEIAAEVIESYRQGASMVHLHVRDSEGNPVSTVPLLQETMEMILSECPDIIIQPTSYGGLDGIMEAESEGFISTTFYRYERLKPMVDTLHSMNPKYMQSTVLEPHSYTEEATDGSYGITLALEDNTVKMVNYLQSHGIKPEFVAGTSEAVVNVREWLIKPGILEKPYMITMGPGMHNAADTGSDPWALLYVLSLMKMMPEDTVIGISAGGRNWLPLTVFAIIMGVDVVRVGLEDHLWLYPHKDEKSQHSFEEVRKISTIAKELGREVATPEEARKIFGMR